MTDKKKFFFRNISCSNCGNISKMPVIGDVYEDCTEYHEEYGPGPDCGVHYHILSCPACKEVNITKHDWHDEMDEEDVNVKILYPKKERIPLGLPDRIKEQYIIADKVKSIDVSLYAIAIRKMLEMVCKDRKANGKTLDAMLKDLAKRNELPGKLVDVAKGVRLFGNMGAHASDIKLKNNEIPLLEALSKAILEYIYSAPYLATVAENKLALLSNSNK